MNLDRIVDWCAPWNDLFSHSKWVSGGVLGAHILALFIGGGLAVAADRLMLRARAADVATRRMRLRDVHEVHSLVVAGTVVLFVTGVLLAAADVETFLPSPIFWLKLSLALLLVVNGALLTRAERRLTARVDQHAADVDESEWSRVRLFAVISVLLWTATAVVGIVLSNAA